MKPPSKYVLSQEKQITHQKSKRRCKLRPSAPASTSRHISIVFSSILMSNAKRQNYFCVQNIKLELDFELLNKRFHEQFTV